MTPSQLTERKARVQKIIKKLEQLFPHAKIVLNFSNNWELMVAVQLSAQCTDKKVNEVTASLFKKYRTLDAYVAADPRAFEQDIRSTGFYKNKTKNILAAANIVKERFHGKLPRTMAEMLTIPGVARKTANIVLSNAYGIVEGIAVDTHVRRLTKKLHLTDHDDPVKIERDLMEIVPEKYWAQMTYLLIDYGRKYCPAKPHKHAECPLYSFEPSQ